MFFLCAGLAVIPHAGIENDEALFAQAIYKPRGELFNVHIGRSHVPVMLMTYLGALKSLIYKPILLIFGTGIWALRVPMLLAAAASIWLFFLLLRRVAGDRAALIGCSILAVDSSYLISSCFDWGPVALQHLLVTGGSLLLVRFYQERRLWTLSSGMFLLGLSLWDKALAEWMLGGLAIAGILTLGRQIVATLTGPRLAAAVLAFGLGALPLIIFNVEEGWPTFHGNFELDTKDLPAKAAFLVYTESRGMFGWLTARSWQTPQPQPPQGLLQTASARISALAGAPHDFWLFYGVALALLLAPLADRNSLRAILFAVMALAVAWIQMAINRITGASVHHTILLWPIPEFLIGISFAAASRKLGRAGIPAIAAATAVLLASGALVINQYYVELWRFGGWQSWNDGIFALSDYVKGLKASNVICMDWGILDTLRLLGRGKLALVEGVSPFNGAEMGNWEKQSAEWMLSDPDNVFLGHTKEFAFFPRPGPGLERFAEAAGYRRVPVAVISDHYGRRVYEVYRFEKRGSGASKTGVGG